ncbi:hypothetical protein WDW37_03130 [Bdellovibrionota bacterium FG-1]
MWAGIWIIYSLMIILGSPGRPAFADCPRSRNLAQDFRDFAQVAAALNEEDRAIAYYDKIFEDGRLDITIALSDSAYKAFTEIPVLNGVINFWNSYGLLPIGPLTTSLPTSVSLTASQRVMHDHIPSILANTSFRQTSRKTGAEVIEGSFVHKGKTIKVRIQFIYPSITSDGTSSLKQRFLAALRSDDVIIYDGHTRTGHGFPDLGFDAMSGTKGTPFKKVGESWLGFDAQPFAPQKYQILMLASCNSMGHYMDVLRKYIKEKPPSGLGLLVTKSKGFMSDDPITPLIYDLVNPTTGSKIMSHLPRYFAADQLFGRNYNQPGWVDRGISAYQNTDSPTEVVGTALNAMSRRDVTLLRRTLVDDTLDFYGNPTGIEELHRKLPQKSLSVGTAELISTRPQIRKFKNGWYDQRIYEVEILGKDGAKEQYRTLRKVPVRCEIFRPTERTVLLPDPMIDCKIKEFD